MQTLGHTFACAGFATSFLAQRLEIKLHGIHD